GAADPSYAPEESEWSGFGIGPWRPIYPTISIVHVVGEKRPLDELLRELAVTAHQNIVIAPQAGERGKTPITARILNARLEIALNLLADMADLQVVKRGNAWLFTSKVHAAALDARAAPPKEVSTTANPVRSRRQTTLSALQILLHDLIVLQIAEQQRRVAIMQPEQQVKDHDRLQKLEEAVSEITEREKNRRIRERQKPGASPFDPEPMPADKVP